MQVPRLKSDGPAPSGLFSRMKISVSKITDWLKQGGEKAPLLFLLILPFYGLEGGFALVAQMQMFQIVAMLSFIFTIRENPISIAHPFRIFALFVLFQLFVCHVDDMSVFHIQMVFMAYVLFEAVYSSSIKFEAFRGLVIFFLYLNLFFCFFQLFNVPLPVLSYLNTDKPHVIQGIWIGSAYCGAFLAFCVPFVLSLKCKIKWPFLILTLFFILKTHSIFALGAALFALAAWLFFKWRKAFIFLSLPSFVAFGLYYWFFDKGDFSGEMQRFFIWTKTLQEVAKEPLFGHALGSYQRFGFENVFTLNGERGLYFHHLHNEYFQAAYEGGALELLLLIALIVRVAVLTVQSCGNIKIFAIGNSLLVLFLIAFGQSVFHIPNLAVFAIFALAVFESEVLKNKRRSVTC